MLTGRLPECCLYRVCKRFEIRNYYSASASGGFRPRNQLNSAIIGLDGYPRNPREFQRSMCLGRTCD